MALIPQGLTLDQDWRPLLQHRRQPSIRLARLHLSIIDGLYLQLRFKLRKEDTAFLNKLETDGESQSRGMLSRMKALLALSMTRWLLRNRSTPLCTSSTVRLVRFRRKSKFHSLVVKLFATLTLPRRPSPPCSLLFSWCLDSPSLVYKPFHL